MKDAADELEARITAEDRALLDQLADAIAKRRLATPALFLLESSRPINLYLSSYFVVFIRPFITMWWNQPAIWDRLNKLLEEREGMELLVRRLEARA